LSSQPVGYPYHYMTNVNHTPLLELFLPHGAMAPSGPEHPHYRGLDTPHSLQLLWMGDQPVAETSTWQHTTLTTDRHPCLRPDSNPQSQQANGYRPTP